MTQASSWSGRRTLLAILLTGDDGSDILIVRTTDVENIDEIKIFKLAKIMQPRQLSALALATTIICLATTSSANNDDGNNFVSFKYV